MRILLVGEYSLLHNSLKEGLIELGHEVILIGNKDGFRQYPLDYNFEPKYLNLKIFNIPRKIIYRLFKFDFAGLEAGFRFYLFLSKLQNFDVVQFINEASVKTTSNFELYLMKKLCATNKKSFMLSTGIDYSTLTFYIENQSKKSILQPYFKNPKEDKEFKAFYSYISKGHLKIHNFIKERFNGIIATDFDYVEANSKNPKYSGFIPCPVNTQKLGFKELVTNGKIIIFLGISKWSYHQKGIAFFEKALDIIKEKYPDRVEVITTNTIPYPVYIELYNKAHILLDQAYSCDQGYNALEAMAKGKVVFTGAESEFVEYYKITEKVCINALPDVDYLVQELSFLIENPAEITAIGKRARAFIEKEHNYIKIAQQYLDVWKS
ncbi:glycosyltransferase family 1 protein [Flavobacterium endoglycinae]|uniref:Glycosyltransferase family 1 protein n=1 Tax=Flavobacterium endoglycinae TaxID=2816357 RepID=A0ABX7QHZ4_9FLAO|nr:glycosyltransferase [Flavobacterium endoglycinae]QSW89996.1 glycosyltransferase family 1 protein [Flavobacterium endoglycinae]